MGMITIENKVEEPLSMEMATRLKQIKHIALDMDATHAGRHIQASAMKRFLVMAVVLALAMTQYRYIHPVGTVLGMFGMKISAFMQPKIHRLMASHKGSSVKS